MININSDGVPAQNSAESSNIYIAIAVGLICLAPLFLTPVLPFIDFYAHILRYYILANAGAETQFASNYLPAWKLLPNLGLDVLGAAILAIVPALLAAKLIAGLLILVLFTAVLYLAHALRGHIPLPSIFLAGILVYSHILVWGFSNFLLGLGLAIGGVAFWIRTRNRPGLQLCVSAVFGIILLFVHAFAFGIWGILLGCVELMLAIEARATGLRPLAIRTSRLLSLAVVPALLFLQMPTSQAEGGATNVVSNLSRYAEQGGLGDRLLREVGTRVDTFLRVAEAFSPPLDRALGLLLWGLIAFGLVARALGLDRRLWIAVAFMCVLVILTPPSLFGVGHVSDRIPLILLALLAAGLFLRPDSRYASLLLRALVGLFVLRMLLISWGYYQAGRVYRDYLAQISAVDTGEIAAAALFAPELGRDRFSPKCEPLAPLLALRNATAVITFANPTQQPLDLSGALKEARDAWRDEPDPASSPKEGGMADTGLSRQAKLRRYFDVGFDTVIACDPEPVIAAPPGTEILAQGGQWVLYGAPRSAPPD